MMDHNHMASLAYEGAGMAIEMDFRLILAVYCCLALFGTGFNALVAWAEQQGLLEGYMSLTVALGVGVTLIGVAFITPMGALVTAGAFVASGLPMIGGSVLRYMSARHAERKSIQEGEK